MQTTQLPPEPRRARPYGEDVDRAIRAIGPKGSKSPRSDSRGRCVGQRGAPRFEFFGNGVFAPRPLVAQLDAHFGFEGPHELLYGLEMGILSHQSNAPDLSGQLSQTSAHLDVVVLEEASA